MEVHSDSLLFLPCLAVSNFPDFKEDTEDRFSVTSEVGVYGVLVGSLPEFSGSGVVEKNG